MLVAAAAQEWNVPADAITVERGVVAHRRPQGELRRSSAQKAAALPVPADVKLKDPKNFALIGKRRSAQGLEGEDERHRAASRIDVKLPGMLTAVVAHPPRFGAKVKSFDAAKAKAIKGVTDVVQIPQRRRGARERFLVREAGPRCAVRAVGRQRRDASSAAPRSWRSTRSSRPSRARCAHKDGDAEAALAGAAKKLEAAFEFPVSRARGDGADELRGEARANGCEIWNGEQFQTVDQANGRRRARPEARAGQAQHAVRRRQLRPARQSAVRLSGRSRARSPRRSTGARR